MKFFKLLFIVLLFLSFKSNAQHGYTISIDVTNIKSRLLQFGYYRGATKPIITESVFIDKPQQHVEFKNSKKIVGGIYCLSFSDGAKINTIDISVDNGAKLHFNLAEANIMKLIADDKLSNAFFSYQKITISATTDERKNALQTLTTNYPQSVVALYAKLELKKMEAHTKAQNSANRTLRDVYFNDIDVQDKRLQFLPNTYSFLNTYFNLLPININNYDDGVDLLLKNANCKSNNYIFYLTWIFKNIAYLRPDKLDNAFRYVYATYLDKEPCKTENEILYAKTTADYKELGALAIGDTIPNFEMQDALGNLYNVKSLLDKSKYTFIAFFDPDCTHCQAVLPQVSKYFDSTHFDKSLVQKISFANAFDFKDWNKFLTDSKLQNWLNVKPKTGDQSYQVTLKIYTNPNFFLIDDKGIIRLKKFDRESITAILKGD